MTPSLKSPEDIVISAINGSAEPEALDTAYLAGRIVEEFEHEGYPLTCFYNGHVQLEMPLDKFTPAQSLLAALDRWAGAHTRAAAQEAVEMIEAIQASEKVIIEARKPEKFWRRLVSKFESRAQS